VDGGKMVAMAENDSIPSMNNMEVEHAYWLYFCPWYDTTDSPFVTGEKYQDKDEVKKLYNSDFCVTLDELPADQFKSSGTDQPKQTTEPNKTTEPEQQALLPGDVNLDKTVDVSDAVLLARFLAEDNEVEVSTQGKLNADVDASGQPDQPDVTKILKFVARLIDYDALGKK
jgi:hypothetical protein